MVSPAYIPDRGHVVWLDFSPHSGHEQAGRRPALILSPSAYNGRAELAIVCTISSKRKGYPFELPIPRGHRAKGVVLTDHVRNVDWRGRHAEFLCELPEAFVTLAAHRVCQLIS